MKTKLYILLVFILSCQKAEVQELDTEILIMVDQSNKMNLLPDTLQVYNSSGLSQNEWSSCKVTLTTILDKEVNPVYELILPSESSWTEDEIIRKAKVKRFFSDLNQKLQIVNCEQPETSHTIIYRNIVSQLNRLAKSTTKHKLAYIYTDCMENSGISFYDPHIVTLLQHEPNKLYELFKKDIKLSNLKGIEIWICFSPKSYKENNTFIIAANFFKSMFEIQGATVYISGEVK